MLKAVFAGLPVSELEPALAWYERLLGRPPDMRPHAGEAVWQLAEGALVYVVVDAERAGRGLLTLIVDEVDVDLEPVARETIAAGRKTVFADPDGNRITFAQLA